MPHALGFHPRNSAVLLLIDDDRLEATLRVDLPPTDEHPDLKIWIAQVVRLLHRIPNIEDVAVVIYAPENSRNHQCIPLANLVSGLEAALAQHDVRFRHAWCRQGSRIWNYDTADGSDVQEMPALDTNETNLSMVFAGSSPLDQPWDGSGVPEWPNTDEVLHLVEDHVANIVLSLEAWNESVSRPAEESTAALHADPRRAAMHVGSLQTKLVRDLLPFLAGEGIESALDTVFGISIDEGDAAIAPLSDFLLGRGWYAPDWQRVDRLWEVCRDLLGVAQGEPRQALLCILAWIEWARGRGSMALVLLNQAILENETYELARLLQKLMEHGVMPAWATDQLRAWRANFS
ncbi:DUF4192 domain-containing protein [Glutamicibacter sp. JL.03c]|uniref:DUF4192 domain-containing protein n=1 Tax=Glutamicibacter sp. JL.03c TaxID=2984842 RepID=UPI0021F778F5|nr:DUF4192 domain-containing protein [Glutamicibacter sp. JL.03c]UYQ79187.1 DUF4192 domain-containing protein [Glutamicibacter sp. JL.03c]